MSQIDVLNASQTRGSVVAVNKVLKNTYMLLGLTLAFSAFMAFVGTNAAPMNIWMYIIGLYGLLFATQALARSAWGLVTIFAFAGWIGYGTGPMIGMYMSTSGGSEIVTTALGGTASYSSASRVMRWFRVKTSRSSLASSLRAFSYC